MEVSSRLHYFVLIYIFEIDMDDVSCCSINEESMKSDVLCATHIAARNMHTNLNVYYIRFVNLKFVYEKRI